MKTTLFGLLAAAILMLGLSSCNNGSSSDDYIKLTPEFIKNFHQHSYDYVGSFRDGMAVVIRDKMVGYINSEGKEVIPCQFKYVTDEGGESGEFPLVRSFSEGLVAVCNFYGESGCSIYNLPNNNGDDGIRWGYADKTGKVVIPIQYTRAGDFHGGVAIVGTGRDDLRLIDKTGKDITDQYTIHEGLIVDADGQIIAYQNGAADYSYCGSSHNYVFPSEGDLILKQNGYPPHSFIDRSGNEVINLSGYSDARPFSDGMAYVSGAGFQGFINSQGEPVIDCSQYADVKDFSSGLAAVASPSDGESLNWGFINKEGALVMPCTIHVPYWVGGLNSFHESRCIIVSGDDDGMEISILNEQGEKVAVHDAEGMAIEVDFQGDFCASENVEVAFSEGLVVATMWNGERQVWGFVDRDGNSTFTTADKQR